MKSVNLYVIVKPETGEVSYHKGYTVKREAFQELRRCYARNKIARKCGYSPREHYRDTDRVYRLQVTPEEAELAKRGFACEVVEETDAEPVLVSEGRA